MNRRSFIGSLVGLAAAPVVKVPALLEAAPTAPAWGASFAVAFAEQQAERSALMRELMNQGVILQTFGKPIELPTKGDRITYRRWLPYSTPADEPSRPA